MTAAWATPDRNTDSWSAPDRNTADWPTADNRLERGYRRLLLAFPRRHRRRHGTELVTTLLEMATPGQRRPRTGEALHLIASGLRLRFRLPAGRPFMALTALLTALTMGGFGAAAGSWLGAQTFADLPDDAAMTRLTQQVGGEAGTVHRLYSTSPWTAETAHSSSQVDGTWDAEQVRQRLADDGWSVSGFTPATGMSGTLDDAGSLVEVPLHGARFTAESDGLILHVMGWNPVENSPVAIRSTVSFYAMPERTAAFLPLLVLGTAVGLLAGWLVAATVAYRMAAATPGRRRAAAALWGGALLALALPAVALYGNVMRVFRDGSAEDGPPLTVHSAFTPGEYYPFGPSWLVLGLSAAGLVVAVAAILLARPGEQPPLQTVVPG
ncbi:hypothetical protein SAMN05443287_113103 [Micromonospora phaseoli]|uniref:Uncharacterized protein n=1 Tax=Micromonospora phaseoli TaxID=1144548 RepID=A0A1H7DLG8_9ACTN|nr:hypothetical protein [Micromonospora phaseoli]PZV90496.1 hypothetical protein CLV64_11333 [Micromonospora phaseoli]GIJ78112.1 hypothetical protein Xph01_25440 [Micromonospora phaseoli]SEK00100.1 hypothetical protein SAMN05443287_113103 [Micromonospora phaseoli]